MLSKCSSVNSQVSNKNNVPFRGATRLKFIHGRAEAGMKTICEVLEGKRKLAGSDEFRLTSGPDFLRTEETLVSGPISQKLNKLFTHWNSRGIFMPTNAIAEVSEAAKKAKAKTVVIDMSRPLEEQIQIKKTEGNDFEILSLNNNK